MTCPHCHVISSRFSDVCTNCGVRLRAPAVNVEAPQSPGVRYSVPDLHSRPLWARRAAMSAMQVAKRPWPRRTPVQWSVPSFLLVLGLAACAGRGARQLYSMSQRGTPPQAIQISSPNTSEQFRDESSRKIINPSNGEGISGIQNQETPPDTVDFRPEDELATAEFLASLHPARVSYVPFPAYSPSTRSLKLEYPLAVPDAVQQQITQSYKKWKWRQSEDATQITRFLNFYAPDARIFCAPENEISRGKFSQIVIEMREAGYFTSVYDQKPLQWAQNPTGDEVELLAYHLYSDDSGNRLWGQRRLTWKKVGKRWLIIRDDFPPRYLSQ